MNAKARRKLLRQQQQQGEVATEKPEAVAVKSEPVVETDEPKTKAEPVAHEAVAAVTVEEQTKPEPNQDKPEPKQANDEKLNAKERRMLARKAARKDAGVEEKPKVKGPKDAATGKKRKRATAASAEEEEDEDGKPRKSIHLTLFVGQLPFKATEAQVRKHFAEAGDIQLRMLTDKKTKRFKGTAFIEVKDSKALGAALSRHHTLLNGRRINVELTASGGGNKSEQRRTKIDLLRKKQSTVQVEKARALLEKHVESAESKLIQDDIDDRVIDFLSWFDYETAKKAIAEFNKSVSDRVMNRKAFFMGILKRFVQTDGVE